MKVKTKIVSFIVLATTTLGMGSAAFADSIYTVKGGDTLSQISFDVLGNVEGVNQLATSNNIENINLIYVGQKLKVSTDGKITEATPEEVAQQPEVSTPETAPAVEATEVEQVTTEAQEAPAGRTITVETTAYDGISLGGVTASGYIIQGYDDKVIAVDPSVIPLGSRVYVPGYGTAIAADTGGAIQGNIIDLNMSTSDAIQWGRRSVTITIL